MKKSPDLVDTTSSHLYWALLFSLVTWETEHSVPFTARFELVSRSGWCCVSRHDLYHILSAIFQFSVFLCQSNLQNSRLQRDSHSWLLYEWLCGWNSCPHIQWLSSHLYICVEVTSSLLSDHKTSILWQIHQNIK